MDSELNLLLNAIKQRTGIDIVVFGESRKFIAATAPGMEAVLPSDPDFEGIFRDDRTRRTYFRLKYKNARLIGAIAGTGEVESNYAYLIQNLVENAAHRELQLSQQDYLKCILTGECNRAQIQRYQRKFAVPESPCFVLIVGARGNRREELMNFLSNYRANTSDTPVALEEGYCAFLKFEDAAAAAEFQSSMDYANILLQSIQEETGIKAKIGVGCTVKSLADVSSSFQQAQTADRICSGDGEGEVHSYKEYLLIKMLEDIPKFKLNEYLEILLDSDAKDIFADQDMINTAEEFLENSLNVSETSRKLYLHRNTLMYRLDKIERATGLNIRKFSDAVTFRLITILYKILK